MLPSKLLLQLLLLLLLSCVVWLLLSLPGKLMSVSLLLNN